VAIEHLGDANDLRHFLPRILDMMTRRDGMLLTAAHLPTLLGSAHAEEWPSVEQQAIASFVDAAAKAGVFTNRIARQILGIMRWSER
jgi:hypothetical protein